MAFPAPCSFSGDYTDSVLQHAAAAAATAGATGPNNNNGYVVPAGTSGEYGGGPPHAHVGQHTLPHPHHLHRGGLHSGSNATLHSALNGGGVNGNMSLTRNRLDLRQDNGLPNLGQSPQQQASVGSMQSLQSGGLLGELTQEGFCLGVGFRRPGNMQMPHISFVHNRRGAPARFNNIS